MRRFPPYPHTIRLGVRPLFCVLLLPFFPALWWSLEYGAREQEVSVAYILFLLLSVSILTLALIRRDPFLRGGGMRLSFSMAMLCLGFAMGGRAFLSARIDYPLLGKSALLVRVQSSPRRTASGFSNCLVRPIACYDTALSAWRQLPRATLQLALRDSMETPFSPYDCLLLEASFTPIEHDASAGHNPNAFSYGQWLSRKGVRGTLWASKASISVLSTGTGQSELPLRDRLQRGALHRLSAHGLSSDAFALSAALAVAQREHVSRELRDAFSTVGIVHILALSGLHVGMIYAIFAFLMRIVPLRSMAYRFLRMGFPLLMVWAFVGLAGGSASLLRAAIMLSAYVIPSIVYRPLHRVDVLLLAAFIILLIEPFELQDAGFQLSFSAVAGIMLFAKPLESLLHARGQRGWVGSIARMLCVSLSAQIGTLPFTMLYFGRLPLMALLLNLLAIPIVSQILPLAFLLILIPPVPWCSSLLVGLQDLMVWILTTTARFSAQIPFVELRGIRTDALGSLLLALAILGVGWVMARFKSMKWTLLSLCAFLPFAVRMVYDYARVRNSEEIVVFHKRGGSLLAHRTGFTFRIDSEGTSEYDSLILRDYTSDLYSAAREPGSFWQDSGGRTHGVTLRNGVGLKLLGAAPSAVGEDCILITSCLADSLSLLGSIPRARMVIVDGSVSARASRRWRAACEARGIPFWSTAERGAFILRYIP